jgi:hypothetical protein
MKKNFWKDTVIIFLVTGSIFVGLELAVRFFSQEVLETTIERGTALAVKDPILGHTLAPDVRAHVSAPEFNVVYEISPQGFRSLKTFAPKAPSDTVRILVVGDSFALGHGIQYPDTWTVLLEERFAAEGKKIEVINAAVFGYSTAQEVLYLERLFDSYSPDIVLLVFVTHDLFTNYPIVATSEGDMPATGQTGIVREIRNEKKTLLHSLTFLKRLLMRSDPVYRNLYTATPRGDYFREPLPPVFDEKIKITTDLFRRAHEFVRGKGTEFAVLSIPQLFQMIELAGSGRDSDAESEPERSDGIVVTHIDEILGDFASSEGFPWMSTLEPLAQTYNATGKDVYFRFDGHINELGSKVVADVAYEGLKPLLEEKLK